MTPEHFQQFAFQWMAAITAVLMAGVLNAGRVLTAIDAIKERQNRHGEKISGNSDKIEALMYNAVPPAAQSIAQYAAPLLPQAVSEAQMSPQAQQVLAKIMPGAATTAGLAAPPTSGPVDWRKSSIVADALKSDALKSDALKSDALKSDALKSDALKSDALKSDALKSAGGPQ